MLWLRIKVKYSEGCHPCRQRFKGLTLDAITRQLTHFEWLIAVEYGLSSLCLKNEINHPFWSKGELQSEPGPLKAGLNALLSSLFDDEFYLDRYATFKSASAGFLLLTLFTQNCTQLRLLVLAKNRDDYVGKFSFQSLQSLKRKTKKKNVFFLIDKLM